VVVFHLNGSYATHLDSVNFDASSLSTVENEGRSDVVDPGNSCQNDVRYVYCVIEKDASCTYRI